MSIVKYILFSDSYHYNIEYPSNMSIKDILIDKGYQSNVRYRLTDVKSNGDRMTIKEYRIDKLSHVFTIKLCY
jgi:hypothetical protein